MLYPRRFFYWICKSVMKWWFNSSSANLSLFSQLNQWIACYVVTQVDLSFDVLGNPKSKRKFMNISRKIHHDVLQDFQHEHWAKLDLCTCQEKWTFVFKTLLSLPSQKNTTPFIRVNLVVEIFQTMMVKDLKLSDNHATLHEARIYRWIQSERTFYTVWTRIFANQSARWDLFYILCNIQQILISLKPGPAIEATDRPEIE